jgi:hypothetical protein
MKQRKTPAERLADLNADLSPALTRYRLWREDIGDRPMTPAETTRDNALQIVLRAYDTLCCVAQTAMCEGWDGLAVFEEITEQHKVFIQSPDCKLNLPWKWNGVPKRRRPRR